MARWREQIDVSAASNHSLPFETQRDRIVTAIRASRWYARQEDELEPLLGDMEQAQDGDEFDGPWSCIYDMADADRVWLSPWPLEARAAVTPADGSA